MKKAAKKKTSPGVIARQEPDLGNEVYHYLPIPDEIFDSGFYITSVGHSQIAPHASYPPAQHPSLYHFTWEHGRVLPEFALIIITAGRGMFESKETGEVPLVPGMALLLFPGTWHRYRPDPETGWTETWMQFNGEFAHRLHRKEIVSSKRPILRGDHLSKIVLILRQLLASIHASPASNTLLVSLQGLSVLGLALSDHASPPAEKHPLEDIDPLVSTALEYIWSRSHQVLSASHVAETLGVTRRTLERHMMKVTGHSLLDAVIDCRYSRAERLLRETDVPIKNITRLAGFGSVQNMRHVFLQRAGCSLADYRHQYRLSLSARSEEGP